MPKRLPPRPEAFHERDRQRCAEKRIFASRNEARDFATKVHKQIGSDQHPYRCCLCKKWHLTTHTPEDFSGIRGLQRARLSVASAGVNTMPRLGALAYTPRPCDAEDVPVGSLVRTPRGLEAVVEGYRGVTGGKGRDHRLRLVCRYTVPVNMKFDVVLLVPELVVIVRRGRDGA